MLPGRGNTGRSLARSVYENGTSQAKPGDQHAVQATNTLYELGRLDCGLEPGPNCRAGTLPLTAWLVWIQAHPLQKRLKSGVSINMFEVWIGGCIHDIRISLYQRFIEPIEGAVEVS
jgi:hypothetical protein